jgi:hypothetical protein
MIVCLLKRNVHMWAYKEGWKWLFRTRQALFISIEAQGNDQVTLTGI